MKYHPCVIFNAFKVFHPLVSYFYYSLWLTTVLVSQNGFWQAPKKRSDYVTVISSKYGPVGTSAQLSIQLVNMWLCLWSWMFSFTLEMQYFSPLHFGLLRPLMVEKVKVKEWYHYLFCDVGPLLPVWWVMERWTLVHYSKSCSSCILDLSTT